MLLFISYVKKIVDHSLNEGKPAVIIFYEKENEMTYVCKEIKKINVKKCVCI